MSPGEARWRLGARDSLGLVPRHLQAQAPRREGRPWAHTALFERVDPVSHSGHLGGLGTLRGRRLFTMLLPY